MSGFIGIVSADPRYRIICRLRRHRKALVSFQGLKVPWCQTCRIEQALTGGEVTLSQLTSEQRALISH